MTEKKFRELNDDEKKFTEKALEGNQAELDHLELMVQYNDFMLDKMLYSNYLEKRRAFGRQSKEYKAEAETLKAVIQVGNEQLTKGVEIKDKGEDASQNNLIPSMVE